MKVNKNIIRKIIDEDNGLAFKNSEPYSDKAKIFFEDRYTTIFSLMPEINKKDFGLEIGLSGGILALSLIQLFNLSKLYTLEHPITCKEYTDIYINKLKKNNIILEPVDLRTGRFPWKDNMFDFIIFSEVMEHLVPSDIPQIVKEIKRVLKKDGWLMVTTPNIASLIKRLNLLREKNPIEFDLRSHEGATFGHIREYTLSELIQILQTENFDIINKGYFTIDAKRNIFLRIENLASNIYAPLGNNIYAIVRKG